MRHAMFVLCGGLLLAACSGDATPSSGAPSAWDDPSHPGFGDLGVNLGGYPFGPATAVPDAQPAAVAALAGQAPGAAPAPDPPPDPAPDPAPIATSFHIVHKDDTHAWDAILALNQAHGSVLVASQNKPVQIGPDRWAQNISVTWYTTGQEMADAINKALVQPDGPAKVMIDELRGDSIHKVADCANHMRVYYPQWMGHWGVYLVNGEAVSYANLQPAIDAVLAANAVMAAEFYPKRSRYCASGSNAGARDLWLAGFFRGGQGAFGQARFAWLAERRRVRNSISQLSVLFGVTDAFLDGTNAAIFLDRMFYVWATRSGFPSIAHLHNGGPGSWKWDQPYMSNSSRDLAFMHSFNHYAVSGQSGSRLGQVPCP